MCDIWDVKSGTLGFAGAREGDGGEVGPVHGEQRVPSRVSRAAGSGLGEAAPCSRRGDAGAGAGTPQGCLGGILYPLHSHFETEVWEWAQGHGGCTEGGSSSLCWG